MTVDQLLADLVAEAPPPDLERAAGRLQRVIAEETQPDHTLVALAVDARPVPAEFEAALAALRRARVSTPRRRPLASAVLALTAILVVGVAGLTLIRQAPAVGALVELAEATRRLPDTLALESEITFSRESRVLDQVVLPEEPTTVIGFYRTVGVEIAVGEGAWTITTNLSPAEFLRPEDATAAESSSVAGEFAARTTTETFTAPPADPMIASIVRGETAPAEAIRAIVAAVPEDEQAAVVAGLVVDVFRAGATDPVVRADLLEVLADLQAFSERRLPDGGVTIQVDVAGERRTITFSAEGWLAAEEIVLLAGYPEIGLPGSTTIELTVYDPPRGR